MRHTYVYYQPFSLLLWYDVRTSCIPARVAVFFKMFVSNSLLEASQKPTFILGFLKPKFVSSSLLTHFQLEVRGATLAHFQLEINFLKDIFFILVIILISSKNGYHQIDYSSQNKIQAKIQADGHFSGRYLRFSESPSFWPPKKLTSSQE